MAEDLKKGRQRMKTAVTKCRRYVNQLVLEGESEIGDEVSKLKRAFHEFTTAHYEYHEKLEDDDDIETSVKYFEEVQDNYTNTLELVNSRSQGDPVGDSASVISRSSEALTHEDLLCFMSLPKLTLETFDGNPMHYHTFSAIFHQNVDSLPGSHDAKLSRLLEYTTGEAKEAIRKCTLIGGKSGYEKAKNILKTRFGDDHLIAERLMENIKRGTPVKSPKEFRYFTDDLENTVEILEKMGMLPELDTQSAMIEIVGRLQPFIQIRWKTAAIEKKRREGRYPSLRDFVAFMSNTAAELNDPVYGSMVIKQRANEPKKTHGQSFHTTVQAGQDMTQQEQDTPSFRRWQEPPCVLCKETHRLWFCKLFKEKTLCERWEVVNTNKLCPNCLLGNHDVKNCRKESVCGVPGCGEKHTMFLHGTPKVSVANVSMRSSSVYMPVVPVVVNGVYQTFALLDTGSTNSFCAKSMMERLNIEGKEVLYELSTLGTNGEERNTKSCEIDVRAANGFDTLNMSGVLVTEKIPVEMPRLQARCPSHLQGLPLVTGPVDVELLIGQDNAEALIPLEIRRGEKGESFATRTILGWSVNGPAAQTANKRVISHFVSSLSVKKNERNTWQEEEVTTEELGLSVEDAKVLELWDERCKKTDGKYELPIPWREGIEFPNNLEMALVRLHKLKNSLTRKGIFERYTEEIDKMLSQGYAEKVTPGKTNEERIWYLPHQAVVTEKKPDKVRLVFDCAAQFKGESLNDKAYQGPDLNNKLAHVILRFRENRYAFMADVEAMYNQVRVPENDRNGLRFLWFNDQGVVQHYRMKSHLFGGVWCASAATYALRQAVDETASGPIKDTINNAFYVDDCLKSVQTRVEAEEIMFGTKSALKDAGFRLTKFVANEDELLANMPLEDVAKEMKLLDKHGSSKALGIRWDIETDSFYFETTDGENDKITRRLMLSYLSSLFDPIGLVGPVILKGKMLYQEAVKHHLGWDEEVSHSLSQEWIDWSKTLTEVHRLKIPRCIKPSPHEEAVLELHHFSDASEKAYGCCSYLRCVNKDGSIHTALIMSKSRVSPIKGLTIPRLELQAAVLAARVDGMLRKELDLPLMTSTFWVDSEIVLCYIKNEERRFQVFVANRVNAIRRSTEPEQWRHVQGTDNPADIISRGCTAKEINVNMWLTGPSFLRVHKSSWRKTATDTSLEDDDPEVKKQAICHRAVVERVTDIVTTDNESATDPGKREAEKVAMMDWHPLERLVDHYSSWRRLKKAVAWLLKIKQTLLDKKLAAPCDITTEDLQLSETEIIKFCQQGLKKSIETRSKDGEVEKLNPYVDHDGIVRVGGRFRSTDSSAKDQAIIPDGKVALLMIRHVHQLGHLGTEYTLAQLRQRYWIRRREVKRALHDCFTCKKLNGRLCEQRMADLPETRLDEGSVPFTHTGVDCFGPFSVKRGRSHVKRYGCIFTCMTTRAIHIEVLDTLDTDSFINALRRFIARRGQPQTITSDNGGNFVKGNKELSSGLKELNQDQIDDVLVNKGIKWKFTPPHSSHMGGVWERQIRTIRKVLNGLVMEQALTDESLRTLMCEVEAIVNNRPITPVSDNPNDLRALRPCQLMLLNDIVPLPPCISDHADMYRRRWRQIQHLANVFWKRWREQYLPELQRRQKWMHQRPNVSVGDLVLLKEEQVPRNLWPLARVMEVNTSKDGLVRSVRLKTRNTQLVRPITKLVMLEGMLY